jgi:inositol-pentakisphosphate 2-kinase
MPPTPFAPSHTTPFKSTLSTAMHGRRAAPPPAASASWPPSAASLLGALDARHWRFLAEGGANLLVAYDGPAPSPWRGPHGQRLALRLTKRSRALHGASGSTTHAPVDATAWREQVVAPLLGEDVASALPATVCLPLALPAAQAFVEQLAARIEMHRPAARRRQDGIDTHAAQLWAVEDLSAPDAQGRDVLLMEIKVCRRGPRGSLRAHIAHSPSGASCPRRRTSTARVRRTSAARRATACTACSRHSRPA